MKILAKHFRIKLSCLIYLLFMILGLGVFVPAAQAVNGISGQLCLKQKTGLNNPSCTANDVRITEVDVLTPGFLGCELGEVINIDIIAKIDIITVY